MSAFDELATLIGKLRDSTTPFLGEDGEPLPVTARKHMAEILETVLVEAKSKSESAYVIHGTESGRINTKERQGYPWN